MRRTSALQRRYGHGHKLYGLPPPGEFQPGWSVDQRHAYREILQSLWHNQGVTKSWWRHWMTQHGLHKAVTERVLTLAERRGHVDVHEGRYYLTPRGFDFVLQPRRESA